MKLLCDRLDQSRRRNHSDLYRVRTDVRKYAVDLLFQEFRCYLENPLDAGRVLGRQCCDRAHSVYSVCDHRL